MGLSFKKAVKHEAKGRVALVGPAGSGKSWTMLVIARLLAGPTGRIAAVDTEHGSLSKYADQFDFDVIELASYSVQNFLDAMDAAEKAGYDVFCCDSLSHFWMGQDGALEFVDERAKRQKDQMGGWKDFRPHERRMVDRIIASPMHVICTMRTKNEYVSVEKVVNGQKKMVREKIGLAPVQREGLEYEFDLVMTMNDDNDALVDKTRCPDYAGKVLSKPGASDFEAFRAWLAGTPRQQQPAPQTPHWEDKAHQWQQDKSAVTSLPQDATVEEIRRDAAAIDTGGAPVGTQAAANAVAEKKLSAAAECPRVDPSKWQAMMAMFAEMERLLGLPVYQEILGEFKVQSVNQLGTASRFQAAYERMWLTAKGGQ